MEETLLEYLDLQTLIFAGVIIVFAWIVLRIFPINLWITAIFSGVRIKLLDLVIMRFRKVPPKLIVTSMILAQKAGLEKISQEQLETHFLAKGNLVNVVKALIAADKANLSLDFKQATAIDLAGRDVLEAVKISITPYIILVPAITGVSSDGIQVIAEARVTVRTNLQQLVGGAGEETIKARVAQGIISRIGEAKSFKIVIEQPEEISKRVLAAGLDAGTVYEILSIDIADINIGKNIGAGLQIDQAKADLEIAQAKAEERRAMAVANEQEMLAEIQEARAKVIEAEAEVPAALSEAYRKGQLLGQRN
jgi:uncharacterized protein YqfA (UPF0365 family)